MTSDEDSTNLKTTSMPGLPRLGFLLRQLTAVVCGAKAAKLSDVAEILLSLQVLPRSATPRAGILAPIMPMWAKLGLGWRKLRLH